MDGVLLKWTNYLSGWQPRYFILEDGILSYYQSKSDINNSCKGSIKVSACDIIAHHADHTRMDVVVPGEACYYVKASTQQERQLWLVALGTCKARSYDTALSFSGAPSLANQTEDECPTGEELLKVKRSELVMYRDLLTQQLYNIKMTLKTEQPPNIELLNEASALVSVTCESFIDTLEDCMQLVDLNSYVRSKESSLSPTSKSKHSLTKGSSWGSQSMTRHAVDRKPSASRASSEEKEIVVRQNSNQSITFPPSDFIGGSNMAIAPALPSTPVTNKFNSSCKLSPVPLTINYTNNNVIDTRLLISCESTDGSANGNCSEVVSVTSLEQRLPTFFTQISSSFADVKLTHEMEIPTVHFLDACRSLVSIFDKLNEQAFIIGKLDIAGNIRKIHQKYMSSPESFLTIQRIIRSELNRRESSDVNSATVALLWLCKSLEFTHELMLQLVKQDCDLNTEDMRKVVGDVYDKILKNHHCWVVRSAFYMILPSMPPLNQMIACLAVDSSHLENQNFRRSLKCDVNDYLTSLRSILHLIQIVFDANGLKISEDAI